MQPDELKSAWQSLDRQLQQHNRLNLQLLRDSRVDSARRGLRPLVFGQCLQMLLGIGLLLLGLACWQRNPGVPGLFATGIALHAFGVVTVVMAALTLMLTASIDYAAPVVAIQRQLARLQRFYWLNAQLCGAPWWVAWVLVVVAFAGLGKVDPGSATPTWISVSFWLGIGGMLATWAWPLLRRGSPASATTPCADGADGIRRGRRLLEEVSQFERE